MGKNIVVCLDGTGNEFEENNSNVVKLFRVIERDTSQVAYYDPGVGTLADPAYKTPVVKKINKLLGLAFGRGITQNVVEAYSFIMDHFEQGDRLFLFGFSRGAYTTRVLAGLIHSCGLLEPGCQNLIPYAMKLYKAEKVDFKTMSRFKSSFGRNVKIDFLGLWDSVSTIGWIYNPVFLPYTTNNKSVHIVRHALAIDEKRSFFKEMRWGKSYKDKQNIKEVWFPGVHSDVGGGYSEKESGLAKISLEWMIKEAVGPNAGDRENPQQFGLKIKQGKFDRYVFGKGTSEYVGPDSASNMHESLIGHWKLVQWIPRSVWLVDEGREAVRKPPSHRMIEVGETLHNSVLERIQKCDYHPPSLNGRSIEEIKKDFNFEP
ncbi:MAG: DUF2235 domain-containing protein [Pseudomonadota bacterium]